MNASKAARNQASITNLPTCGGSKKGGLAPTGTSFFLSSNPNMIGATNSQFGLKCVGNYTSSAQSTIRKVKMGMV
jgi:hypothetical protein